MKSTATKTEQHNMTTTFNGWTNRETWQANLWLDNDGIFEMFREDREAVTPERLESFLEELLHEHTGQGSLLGDIVTDWMSSVDFDEIAQVRKNRRATMEDDQDSKIGFRRYNSTPQEGRSKIARRLSFF